jgi:hypothetical protein
VADFIPPRLEKLNFQPDVQKLLLGLLAHPGVTTFLWVGPEGTGKKTYALSLVRSLFCQEGPECAGCAACRQVLNRTHPDLFWVEREYFWTQETKEAKSKIIPVKAVSRLVEKLGQAPFSAPLKVAVIPSAGNLQPAAQDKFLKTLEEPPPKTLIILLAEKTGDFLPTVLSRCRIIRFPALPLSTLQKLLVENQGWKPEQARLAALEANGNLTLALKCADEAWKQFREKVCSDFDRGLMNADGEWLEICNEYDQWEPEILGEMEMNATQRKAEVLRAAFQVYIALWSRRLSGEADTPKKLSTLPADTVLKNLQKHQDIIPRYLAPKMILDHLFLELGEGFRKGELANLSFAELSTQI